MRCMPLCALLTKRKQGFPILTYAYRNHAYTPRQELRVHRFYNQMLPFQDISKTCEDLVAALLYIRAPTH